MRYWTEPIKVMPKKYGPEVVKLILTCVSEEFGISTDELRRYTRERRVTVAYHTAARMLKEFTYLNEATIMGIFGRTRSMFYRASDSSKNDELSIVEHRMRLTRVRAQINKAIEEHNIQVKI